jgi:ankyrin repeat protein
MRKLFYLLSLLISVTAQAGSFPTKVHELVTMIRIDDMNGKVEDVNELKTYLSNHPTVDLTIRDSLGMTPLGLTRQFSKQLLETTELLLKFGADPSEQIVTRRYSETYLHHYLSPNIDYGWFNSRPSFSKGKEFAIFFIDAGANVNAIDSRGYSPLMLSSAFEKFNDVTDYLLQNGANPNISDSRNRTPYMLLSQQHFHENNGRNTEDLRKKMLIAGYNPNLRDQNGDTFLMRRLRYSRFEHVKVLDKELEAGLNVNIRNNVQESLLMIASYYPDSTSPFSIVETIVKAGANIHLKNNLGQSVLQITSKNFFNGEIVQYLFDNGAKINEQDNEGNTALMITLKGKINTTNERSQVYKVLVKNGADLTLKNNMGLTALDIAIEKNNLHAINFLKAAGAE